ncbi:DUF1932 domain-containing protein [Paracoccus sp. (in: a-proteobacteria)]|uniref:NAD(P)-dependent oxidoreductase n=1 Tax=Paracoccus sp. TaxID=267 RepID=UPI003A8C0565
MGATIAFIGFGEAGQAIAQGWGPRLCASVAVFDQKTGGPEAEAIRVACAATGVVCADDRGAALAGARYVLCLVTADQAVAAARQAARHLAPGAIWYDGNSCAPDSKREAAAIIGAAGGVYVDLAVMAPIHPRLHRTPMLVAGPQEATGFLDMMGMDYRWRGPEIGSASAVKMIRSVMIKGIEALTAECFLAAGRAGVLEDVLASLQSSDPQTDWRGRADYNLERMMQHGQRRAAEMREVAATVVALGLPDRMAGATVGWQQHIGDLALRGREGGLEERLAMVEKALCSLETSVI